MSKNEMSESRASDQRSSMSSTAKSHYKDWPNEAGFNALAGHRDTQTPVSLDIVGRFPNYAAGSLFRTGPALYKIPRTDRGDREFAVSHWFDGFTTTHRFDLVSDSTGADCTHIQYSSRLQADALVEYVGRTGRLDGVSFGQKRDPCDSLYRKVKSFFEPSHAKDTRLRNIGVSLRNTLQSETAGLSLKAREAGKVMSIGTDNSSTLQFDTSTLEPLGVTDQSTINSSLSGTISAAHPSHDPKTGEIFNYNLSFGPYHTYKVWRASPNGDTEVLATIRGPFVKGAYIHSLLITENFVILCVWPLFFQFLGIAILWHRNMLDALKFDPSSRATWYVVDRHHGRGVVKQFTSPAFFCFHTTNAWEEPGEDEASVNIVCELVEFSNSDILHKFYYENMVSTGANAAKSSENFRRTARIRLSRYQLDKVPMKRSSLWASMGKATKILEVECGDLPRFNPDFALRKHRYVYSVLDRGNSSFLDGIGKTDTEKKTMVVWEKPRHTPGEPVFIPAPNATEEDVGVVFSVVLNGDTGTSYLLCLDARTFQEIGRAAVPAPVGFGFHGIHIGSAVL